MSGALPQWVCLGIAYTFGPALFQRDPMNQAARSQQMWFVVGPIIQDQLDSCKRVFYSAAGIAANRSCCAATAGRQAGEYQMHSESLVLSLP